MRSFTCLTLLILVTNPPIIDSQCTYAISGAHGLPHPTDRCSAMTRDGDSNDGVDYAHSFEFFCKNSQMYYYSYNNPSCDGEPVNNEYYEFTGDYNCDGSSSDCEVIARYTADCDYLISINFVVQDMCTPDGYKVECTDDDEGVIREYLNDDCDGDPYESLPDADIYDFCSATWHCDQSAGLKPDDDDTDTDTETDGKSDDNDDTYVDSDDARLTGSDETLTDGEIAAIVIVIIAFVLILSVILYRRFQKNGRRKEEKNEAKSDVRSYKVVQHTPTDDTDFGDEGLTMKELENESKIEKGWIVMYTSDGKKYYQNNITKETRWNKPDGAAGEGDVVALPTGWSKLCTPDGRAYYQNDITKSTQWEQPC